MCSSKTVSNRKKHLKGREWEPFIGVIYMTAKHKVPIYYTKQIKTLRQIHNMKKEQMYRRDT
jgi:hypothetical protein